MNDYSIAAALAVMLLCAGALPSWSQEAETAVTPEGCRTEKFAVPSACMKRNIRSWVVLPPAYLKEEDGRFPVLICLHGRSAPYTTWSEMSRLRACLASMPMILAGFDGDIASQYVDSPINPSSQFQTFIFDEFIPFIHARYRTDGRQAITGFSMGGFGALYSMLSKPQAFVSVSGLSSSLPTLEGKADPTEFVRRFSGVLGSYEEHRQAYEAADVCALLRARAAEGVRLPPMMLRCGTRDRLLPETRAFVDCTAGLNAALWKRIEAEIGGPDSREKQALVRQRYEKERIELLSVESDGAHDWTYWHSQSPAVAEFHWKWFSAQR